MGTYICSSSFRLLEKGVELKTGFLIYQPKPYVMDAQKNHHNVSFEHPKQLNVKINA